jgi:hypothetical protein
MTLYVSPALQKVRNSGPKCCSVYDNWRLVVAIRKLKVKLLNLRVRHCGFQEKKLQRAEL